MVCGFSKLGIVLVLTFTLCVLNLLSLLVLGLFSAIGQQTTSNGGNLGWYFSNQIFIPVTLFKKWKGVYGNAVTQIEIGL